MTKTRKNRLSRTGDSDEFSIPRRPYFSKNRHLRKIAFSKSKSRVKFRGRKFSLTTQLTEMIDLVKTWFLNKFPYLRQSFMESKDFE